MTEPDGDPMNELDGLNEWIQRRARTHRTAAWTWVVATSICGALALVRDDCLFLPLVPLLGAASWLIGVWAADQWWRARSARAGHPIVWADAPWTVAARRPLPPGWQGKEMPGTLHRCPDAWLWRPSALFAPKVCDLRWAVEDVVVVTATPIRSMLPPPKAQLRLYLRSSGSVDLLVRQPSRLGPLVGAGTAVGRDIPGKGDTLSG